MTRRLFAWLIGMVAGAWVSAALAMPPIVMLTTPKGIKVWFVEDKSVPILWMSYSFEGGSAGDPAGKEGVASMLSSLLDQGAGQLDAAAFKLRQEELAVRLGFGVSHDRISGSFATLVANRRDAFEFLRLALMEPRFDADELERVRRSMQVALRRGDETPNTLAYRIAFEAMFPGHPYGRPTGGTQASLAALDAGDLRAAHRRLLVRDRLAVAVVGDIAAQDLVVLIDRVFADLPTGQDVAAVPAWSPPTTARTVVVERAVPQSVLLMLGPGISRDDPDWYAAWIANRILGGGQQSRLFTEIREKRGLAYGANSGLRTMRKASLFIMNSASANERMAETMVVAREEIARLGESGPTEEELSDAKSYFSGAQALSLDSGSSIAGVLHALQVEGLPPDHFARQLTAMQAVTLQDVARASRRLFRPELLTTVVVGKPVGVKSSE